MTEQICEIDGLNQYGFMEKVVVNRKKKISQKIAKRLKNAKAKKNPRKKTPYIAKADREAIPESLDTTVTP